MKRLWQRCQQDIAALPWCFQCLLLSVLIFPAASQAEVWGYIDERGFAHFAPTKLDARYELFFKDGRGSAARAAASVTSIASIASAPPAEVEIPRPVAVPAGAAKLNAFFAVSTNFKAVQHWMREAATAHTLDFELLQAVISAESGFDPQAVSPKGAVGLMQLMPATAQRMGVRAEPGKPIEKRLTDPRTNIAAGARYLRELMNLYPGRLDLVLASYNAGEGAVQRAGNQIPNYKETRDYVRTVTQIYQWLKPPSAVNEARKLKAEEAQRQAEAALAERAAPKRAEQVGGAVGRGNMVRGIGESGVAVQMRFPSPLAVASEPAKP